MDLKEIITSHPDFPKKGIVFRDFAPVLRNPQAMEYMLDTVQARFPPENVDIIAGIESRGFILGAALAQRYGRGFMMIRKAGKTPGRTHRISYDIEYGSDTIEIRQDALQAGQRVLLCDDLLATGGTAAAAATLIEKAGGVLVGIQFIIELESLQGRSKIPGHDIASLVVY